MSVQAISRFFKLGIDDWQPQGVDLPEQTILQLDSLNRAEEEILREAVLFTYDIREDDKRLRENPDDFETLRGDYPVRREFPVFTIQHKHTSKETLEKLKQIGFKIA